MPENMSLESTAKVGGLALMEGNQNKKTISLLIPMFLKSAQYDSGLSPQTVAKYCECLNWVIRHLGDLEVGLITPFHLTDLKQKILTRGASESRVASMIFAVKSFLRFCRESLELDVLDYKKIVSPKRHRREVIFLTNEEVQQFLDSIRVEKKYKINLQKFRMDGLRFRTLAEVLLGTGMRISEALSLNRQDVDFEKAEAKIIGKGNKERTVFFTQRALSWVKLYLDNRKDDKHPLFITNKLTRLSRADISKLFRNYSSKCGVNKKITPHILRHTTATNLLFNGCPISHVKEILGHERLETTCRYYLGVDKRKAKEAHNQYLNF